MAYPFVELLLQEYVRDSLLSDDVTLELRRHRVSAIPTELSTDQHTSLALQIAYDGMARGVPYISPVPRSATRSLCISLCNTRTQCDSHAPDSPRADTPLFIIT